jgi:hypothetical protein
MMIPEPCRGEGVEIPRETQDMIDRAAAAAATRRGYSSGPLKVEKVPRTDDGDADWAIVDGLRKTIGIAYGRAGEHATRPAEGNARLWAAAPDFYLNLRMFVTILDRHGEWRDGCFHYKGIPCPELGTMINEAHLVLSGAFEADR